eukprot:9900017-Alexandrium_andersonii.AAC.1
MLKALVKSVSYGGPDGTLAQIEVGSKVPCIAQDRNGLGTSRDKPALEALSQAGSVSKRVTLGHRHHSTEVTKVGNGVKKRRSMRLLDFLLRERPPTP